MTDQDLKGNENEKDNFADAFLPIFFSIDKLWRNIDI